MVALAATEPVRGEALRYLNRLTDWLFVIERGRLVLEGSPAQVFAQRQRLEALNLGIPPSLDQSLIRR